MNKVLFTLAGANFYYGTTALKCGMKVRLIKEPDNRHDKEAIRVELDGLGKIGYVANSTHTVKGESMSAGRLYDKIGDTACGKILFVFPDYAVCKVRKKSLLEPTCQKEAESEEIPFLCSFLSEKRNTP